MAQLVQDNLKLIIDAVSENDTGKAIQVWRSDQVDRRSLQHACSAS